MKQDVLIIGAGPAGIFTALEMLKNGSTKKITIVEKGLPVRKRHCPKDKTGHCVNCKPDCNITTGFSGAGAFSDGKLSLSYEVGGNLPELIGHNFAQEMIEYTDKIYLSFGADERVEGIGRTKPGKGNPSARHSGGTKAGRLSYPPPRHGNGAGALRQNRTAPFGQRRHHFV